MDFHIFEFSILHIFHCLGSHAGFIPLASNFHFFISLVFMKALSENIKVCVNWIVANHAAAARIDRDGLAAAIAAIAAEIAVIAAAVAAATAGDRSCSSGDDICIGTLEPEKVVMSSILRLNLNLYIIYIYISVCDTMLV